MNKGFFKPIKKILLVFFATLLFVSVGVLLSACKCKHDYKMEVTKSATCGSTGIKTYTCNKCGDSYTEEIPVTGNHNLSATYLKDDDEHWQKCSACDYVTDKAPHAFETTVSVEPSTCTQQGSKVTSCVCGETHTEQLQLAEHTYSIFQKSGAEHWLKCSKCDATTAKTAHTFTTVVSIEPSTCMQHGSKVTACECGETHMETLPLGEHRYIKNDYNDNEHWLVCADCNAEKPNQNRIPHDLTVKTTPADCEHSGQTVTTCSGCEYKHTEIIKKLGHDLNKSAGFSNASTGSGHYYRCNRCGKDIAEPHTLENCECPNGYNRDATCYQTGHQDQKCSVCNWSNHFTTPRTDNHSYSVGWSSNGTHHWHACTNGDGQCDAHGEEAAHTWIDKSTPATCEIAGRAWRECSVCGCEQSGSNRILKALGHDYKTVEIITAATCSKEGLEKVRCTRCEDEKEIVTQKLEHDMTAYEATAEGHYRKCASCGYTQTTIRNHTWNEVVEREPTCTQEGLTVKTCEYCKYTCEEVTTKNHNYITVEGSVVDPTCQKYGSHVGKCSECGDVRTFEDKHLGYAAHNVKEYPAKEMTATEPGNRHYWQCNVCGKYFTSHGCVEELTEDEVFIYPPKIEKPQDINELLQLAAEMTDNTVSKDFYQITAVVEGVETTSNTLMIGDGESIFVTLIARENAATINVNDRVTLKGRLLKSGNDITLVDCEIISVDCGDDELFSLFLTVTEESNDVSYYLSASDDADGFYLSNTNNYNCLMSGMKLTFNCYKYKTGTVLQKVIINQKPYTVVDGELELTVTGDVHAEFVFDTDNYCSVTLREIDTSNKNGADIIADEYVSYKYTNGGYNEYGRLHYNSHLTFAVNNANLTGINITYDADWLSSNPEIVNNTINAIKAGGAKVAVEQKISSKGQVVLTFSATDGYVALEYFANVKQARVTEITVLYQTNNTLA